MNFYPHHIGDYLTSTAHLTWLEDCAYRRLLDLYYSKEQAVPTDLAKACRLVRATSEEEREAVSVVLDEFFTSTDAGWIHTRCEEEIARARAASERARENGRRGGRPPKRGSDGDPTNKTQPVSGGNPPESGSQAPNPITNTNTSSSVPNGTGGEPPADALFSARDGSGGDVAPALDDQEVVFHLGLPILTKANVNERNARSLLGMLVKRHGKAATARAVERAADERPLDPVAWLQAALSAGGAERGGRQEQLEARGRKLADDWAGDGQ